MGELVEIAVARGRQSRPKIKLGICGEHGGDPDSIRFCHEAGLDYVSCSPFRVPVARLAAAPTTALALTKQLFNRSLDDDRAASFLAEAMAQELQSHSVDATEGVTAFVERRPPEYRGH